MGDLQRQALARDIARRLQLASHDQLRVIDRALLSLELQREGRRDPGDVLAQALQETAELIALEDGARAGLHEAARAEMVGAAQTGLDVRPLDELLTPEQQALINQVAMQPRSALREDDYLLINIDRSAVPESLQHVAEPLPVMEAIRQGIERVREFREFAPDAHLTRVSTEPARIALEDTAEPYAAIDVSDDRVRR